MTAAEQWAIDLASWAIPQEILDQAPANPWIHPVAQFTPPDDIPDSPSHERAREALPPHGSVLDVGSGGGRASMALVPPAAHVVAVDNRQEMLDVARQQAAMRGATFDEVLGTWPDVEAIAPICDIVTCHHVAFNVPDIIPFLRALDSHAAIRVVTEMPIYHPLSNLSPLWQHFWGLERPTGPTADDLVECAAEAGITAQIDVWDDPSWGSRVILPEADRVAVARTRLCLTPDRDPEIAEVLAELGPLGDRRVATIWWDVQR